MGPALRGHQLGDPSPIGAGDHPGGERPGRVLPAQDVLQPPAPPAPGAAGGGGQRQRGPIGHPREQQRHPEQHAAERGRGDAVDRAHAAVAAVVLLLRRRGVHPAHARRPGLHHEAAQPLPRRQCKRRHGVGLRASLLFLIHAILAGRLTLADHAPLPWLVAVARRPPA